MPHCSSTLDLLSEHTKFVWGFLDPLPWQKTVGPSDWPWRSTWLDPQMEEVLWMSWEKVQNVTTRHSSKLQAYCDVVISLPEKWGGLMPQSPKAGISVPGL